MRSDAFAGARFMALPSIALVAVAFVAPGRAELALRIYALLLSATLIVLLVRALRRAYPNEKPLREPGPAAPARSVPPSLARIEHDVALGVAGSFDLHYRLVPRLRSVATELLDARRNVSFEASPDRAHALLGDEAWALVRPDRTTPQDRLGPGMSASELDSTVQGLEGI